MARKLPEKLYRIGEVMEHTGLTRQTIDYYTGLGLLRYESRTRSGYRLYPPSVFSTLDRVKSLKKKGYTLGQIREILGSAHATRRSAAKTKATATGRRRRKQVRPPKGDEIPGG